MGNATQLLTSDSSDAVGAANPLPVVLAAAGAGVGVVKYASVSVAASGSNSLVALVSAKKIRVLGYVIVADGAVNVTFLSAAAAISGVMQLTAAGSGIASGYAPCGWFETTAGVALNLNLSAAVGVRGHLMYQEI
jgi:hypothetical protein